MMKRDRLENTLAGESTDRPPVALWRYFPGDNLRPNDHVAALEWFHRSFEFDFAVFAPPHGYCVRDYGLTPQWQHSLDGQEEWQRDTIQRSLDWTELRRLEPHRGLFSQQVTALNLLDEGFTEHIPTVIYIPSPLTQAAQLAGDRLVLQHLRTHPDRIKTGLHTLADNILRFMESIRKLNLAGIVYDIHHANYDLMSETEYLELASPFDRKILTSVPQNWWLKILSLRGQAPMLKVVASYMVNVIAWQDDISHIDFSKGKNMVQQTVWGGVGHRYPLQSGMPGQLREGARQAMEAAYGRHLILGANMPMALNTPLANIRAVGQAVDDISRVS